MFYVAEAGAAATPTVTVADAWVPSPARAEPLLYAQPPPPPPPASPLPPTGGGDACQFIRFGGSPTGVFSPGVGVADGGPPQVWTLQAGSAAERDTWVAALRASAAYDGPIAAAFDEPEVGGLSRASERFSERDRACTVM